MPDLTLAAAVPPNRERVYFEGCDRFPFSPHATACHLVNAWWLAEASFAAYETFESTGRLIDLSPVLAAGYEVRPAAVGSTQFITLESAEVLIIAFRGTRLDEVAMPLTKSGTFVLNWADVATDARALPKMIAPEIFVHQGFHQAYESIRDALSAALAGAARQRKPVWLTRHSLGGALATLAAYEHGGRVHGLYTFGSPRVGNGGFAQALVHRLPNIWRFVHHRDLIPVVPPEGPPGLRRYAHAGNLKFISGKQTWKIEDGGGPVNTLGALAADALAHARAVGRTLAQHFSLLDPKSWPITFEALTDHSPMYYANKIFNAHEDSLGTQA